ncbi:MAG: aminotransferase class I/II-fold pyridoxal phosphate-dependent enzyme [bacterium]
MLTVSGGAANAVALTGLVGDGDFIFSDADNHASTIDAGRLSRANVKPYRSRDTAHLAELLEATRGLGQRLVVTNGVFSMDGGLAPLPDIVQLCGRHGAQLVVDDAHATGVVGQWDAARCRSVVWQVNCPAHS